MKSCKKIGFIGFGNMGKALGLGLTSKGYEVLYNDFEDKNVNAVRFCDTETVLNECKYVFLAIKPYQYEEFLKINNVEDNIIISIAAGVKSSLMTRYCNKYVLTMPNTPATLNLGYTVIVNNDSLSSEELDQLVRLFSGVGITKIIKEDELSKYICITGSSPAYFFDFIDSLSSAVSKVGANRTDAEKQLAYVMKAAAEMILSSDISASVLRDNVCSPNGTTIQAIDTFKNKELDLICEEAVTKCFDRANEMKIK